MANAVVSNFFPSQVASDQEKMSPEYGLQVGRAIQNEWFDGNQGSVRFRSNQDSFHSLRLYARGEQPIQKYKDELSINGDLSYLNLDWKPVPILSKFVDIVVNGIADRSFDIKAFSQDPYGVKSAQHIWILLLEICKPRSLTITRLKHLVLTYTKTIQTALPESKEELELHMQLSYKQGIEIAEEVAINTLLDGNNYDLIKRRVYHDLTTIGIGAVKNTFSESEGVVVDYVDPANLVYSYTESPYFDDIYYVGEVKTIPISELKKQFPGLTQDDLDKIKSQGSQNLTGGWNRSEINDNRYDSNTVQVLYFNYKTYMNEVYKIKETASGAEKVILRDDQFNPPADAEGFAKASALTRSTL